MIKLTFCLVRLPHLTREAFQNYWRNTHGPLVAQHRGALRIARYVQLHSADPALSADLRAGRGGPEPYDGVAQLWWTSQADLDAALADPAGQKAGAILLEDEKRFIDLARSPLWWGEEHVIFG